MGAGLIVTLLTTVFGSSKAIEFGISMITRLINRIDDNEELRKQWARTTRLIDKKIPVRLMDEERRLIVKLDEADRVAAEVEKRKDEQIENFKVSNQKLYSEYLSLEDKLVKAENNEKYFRGEF